MASMSTLAGPSFIIGVVSALNVLFLFVFLPLLPRNLAPLGAVNSPCTAALAIILGGLSLNNIHRSDGALTGRTLGIVGICFGVFSLDLLLAGAGVLGR